MTAPASGLCDHCALPIGRRALEAEIGGQVGRYCCSGCALAATVTRARGDPAIASALLVRLGLAGFFTMNVMMLTLPTYARHVYGEDGEGVMFLVLAGLAGLLTVPVLILLGGPIVGGAVRSLRARRASSDVLIAIAVGAAFLLSVANLAHGSVETYFDTTVLLLVLVTGGRYAEALAKARATESVRQTVSAEAPQVALVEERGRRWVEVGSLRPGDVVEIGPGDRVPTDGRVIEGEADVDESLLTGEPTPQWKGVGSSVAGGTCSVDGKLRIRVEREAARSADARIAALLEQARLEPSEIEASVDRLAAWMVPVVAALALGAAVGWWAAGESETGVLAAVAVLVVACPCGLVLATPVAIARALSGAAENGVVVRSASVFETAAAVDTVFFDKTGTLTQITPRLAAIEVHAGELSERALLGFAAAVEDQVGHPLARAIVSEARARGLDLPRAETVRVVPGRGVHGVVGGERIGVGNAELARTFGLSPSGDGVWVFTGSGALARCSFEEEWAPGASEAIADLRNAGLEVGLLTGDSRPRLAVEDVFGDREVHVGLRPKEKLDAIRTARRRACVAMVGEGVNDMPALAAADVGIAVSGASDWSRVSAGVALLRGNVDLVPAFLLEARRLRRIVRQNLAWSAGYNGIALALAASAQLTPVVAALAMVGSSLIVLANSRRARWERQEEKPRASEDRTRNSPVLHAPSRAASA